jgi:hypothetical protein
MIRVSFVVLGHISLVLTSVRRSPGAGSVGVQAPTLPIVDACILLRRYRSVNLFHRLNDQPDMVFFAHSLEERTCGGIVRSQKGSRTGTVDVVCGVAERSDSRKISRTTTSDNGRI